MNCLQLKTSRNPLSGIKKAPLSSFDNRAMRVGDTGLEPVTSCL